MTLRVKKNDTVHYCLECIGKMSIKCAWCQNPIVIGDMITLYSPTDPTFVVSPEAYIYKQDPLVLVGCLGWDCAQTGLDRAGRWMPPGEVHLKENLWQKIINADPQSMMIVEDLSDPNDNGVLIPLNENEVSLKE